MTLARAHTWVANDGLMASDLNGEFNNIINNGLALISPLTKSLDAGGFKLTGLAAATTSGDLARFDDATIMATQAQQETGSSTTVAVTPGRQKYHQSACKAWGCVDASGGTVSGLYNVVSVNDAGTGITILTFTTALSALGCYIASVDNNGTPLSIDIESSGGTLVEVVTKNTAGSAADPSNYSVCCFGDFA